MLWMCVYVQATPHENVDIKISHTEIPEKEGDFYVIVEFRPKKGWHLYWQNPGDSGMPPKADFILPDFAVAKPLGFPPPELFKNPPYTTYGYSKPFKLVFEIHTTNTLQKENIKIDLNWVECNDKNCKRDSLLTTLEDKDQIFIKDAQAAVDTLPEDIFIGSALKQNKTLIFKGEYPHATSAYFFPLEQNYIETDAPQKFEKYPDGTFSLKVPVLEQKEKATGLLILKTQERDIPLIVDHAVEDYKHDFDDNILMMFLFALLGGLILNLMPCVFPVLSLKILNIIDHTETKQGMVRHGLSYTVGVFVTFMTLFSIITVLKSTGQSVGWGFQLQSPEFVVALIFVFFLLSLNLFGVFEFSIIHGNLVPVHYDHKKLYSSFLNGILTTIVATPCTAPFMGTALTVALSQSLFETFCIFFALSLGLALPFLILCFYPKALKFLPSPGKWMEDFKQFLAFPMLGGVVWLLWVLETLKPIAFVPVCCALVALGFISWFYGRCQLSRRQWISILFAPTMLFFCLLFYPNKSQDMNNFYFISLALFLFFVLGHVILILKNKRTLKQLLVNFIIAAPLSVLFIPLIQIFDETKTVITATPFDNDIVEDALKNGRPVFINFTARWCMTCQINKLNVLSSPNVKKAFKDANVLYLEADWTNRSRDITNALKTYGKESIPVYVLKSPKMKKPILLPELLTEKIVLQALQNITP
ncbi:MAG: Thiol:disulfide interchange protein DsbD [Holosporales bacterium]